MEKLRALLKKKSTWVIGGLGALIGLFTNGALLEKVIAEQLLEAVEKGDMPQIMAYSILTFVVWFELRGLKKVVGQVNETVAKGFREGEHRFQTLESVDLDHEHRLTEIETFLKLKTL